MRRAVVVLLALLVLGLYFSGRLDHLLYNVGLNYNECARNGFGALFCGSELDQYRQRVQATQERVNADLQQIHATGCRLNPSAPGCP